ncbi:sugar ABC transporter substrate-binding protein [Ferviditalea candida]|uniref:Extracellular solute-binding protein n=1 Tax=Ferviditalea candida TaxID=3108399 RepID=A0ABU5ZH81_9BACL|nr:extracellular solute-binding protein [Paenibacillaceae bacterium T2]
MSGKTWLLFVFSMILLAFVLFGQLMDRPDQGVSSREWQANRDSGGQTSGTKPESDSKTLKVAVSMSTAEFTALQKINQAYEENHPGADISLQNIPGNEAYSSIKSAAQSGVLPDILLIPNGWVNEFAASGFLSYRTEDFFTGRNQANELEPLVSQMKWNGYIWGIPKDADPYVLVWNKTVLSQKGLDGPPNTPQEFLSSLQLLAGPEENAPMVYIDPEDPYALISLVWALGGDWAGEGSSSPDGKKAAGLDKLLEAVYTPTIKKADKKQEKAQDKLLGKYIFPKRSDPWAALNQGSFAMMIARASDFLNHRSAGIGVSMLPAVRKGESVKAGWLDGRSFCVAAQSDAVTEAFDWIKAVTAEKNQEIFLTEANILPAAAAVLDTQAGKDKNLQEIRQAVKAGRVLQADPFSPQKFTQMRESMRGFYEGRTSAEELAKAVDRIWLRTPGNESGTASGITPGVHGATAPN